ncbi:MAG: methyltransferase domain-containing protein [Candidatus Protistobacter heckmanni]|nr:methyltransferase domain-containing protein [Candidatus Protistobacter heckmanni]
MPQSERQFDSKRLRLAFGRRAPRFAATDFLLREIESRMHERLEPVRIEPKRIVDLGCAAGGSFAGLRRRFPEAEPLGLDWSAPMLRAALSAPGGAQASSWLKRLLGRGIAPLLVQADWSNLPLASGSANLVWSNLALHWSAEPHKVLPEWARLLPAGDGLLIFSAFGPDTFAELRAAFAEVDSGRHLPDFVDMHDLGDMLIAAGLADPVMDAERLTLTYQTSAGLLEDVRALGVYPGLAATGLRGRGWLARLHAALERRRNASGLIPLSLEIVYGHAWKPVPTPGRVGKDGVAILRSDQIGRSGKR